LEALQKAPLWRIWPYIGALVVALAIVAAVPGCRPVSCNGIGSFLRD